MAAKKSTKRQAVARKPLTAARGACLLAGPRLGRAVVTEAAVAALVREAGPAILPRLVLVLLEHRETGQRSSRHPLRNPSTVLHVVGGEAGLVVGVREDFGGEEKAA